MFVAETLTRLPSSVFETDVYAIPPLRQIDRLLPGPGFKSGKVNITFHFPFVNAG